LLQKVEIDIYLSLRDSYEYTDMKKKSISDIAKELKISVTTVSFIINGKAEEKRISKELTQRVLKYIDEVGYRPNPLAQSLRTGKTNTIGLMVENIANPFFGKIARKIEEEAYKNGYRILYCSTDNDKEKTKDLIKMFRERQVDGYIISPPNGIEEDITSLITHGIPVIAFDRRLENLSIDCVLIENYAGTYKATKHLIQSYTNIGFITLDSEQTQMVDRLSGYLQAIADNKLNSFVKKIPYKLIDVEIQQQIKQYLKKNPKIDALIFATNYLGVNGLKAIRSLYPDMPSALGLVAFDNHDLFELHTPSITTIAQPVNDIANAAIQLLIKKLKKGASKEVSEITLPTILEIRDSSTKKKVYSLS
jgi:LacI family transcriptional regulator